MEFRRSAIVCINGCRSRSTARFGVGVCKLRVHYFNRKASYMKTLRLTCVMRFGVVVVEYTKVP